jgi:hypothetical protein
MKGYLFKNALVKVHPQDTIIYSFTFEGRKGFYIHPDASPLKGVHFDFFLRKIHVGFEEHGNQVK